MGRSHSSLTICLTLSQHSPHRSMRVLKLLPPPYKARSHRLRIPLALSLTFDISESQSLITRPQMSHFVPLILDIALAPLTEAIRVLPVSKIQRAAYLLLAIPASHDLFVSEPHIAEVVAPTVVIDGFD